MNQIYEKRTPKHIRKKKLAQRIRHAVEENRGIKTSVNIEETIDWIYLCSVGKKNTLNEEDIASIEKLLRDLPTILKNYVHMSALLKATKEFGTDYDLLPNGSSLIFNMRRECVKKSISLLEKTKAQLRATFKNEVGPKSDYFSQLKWLQKSKSIQQNLTKRNRLLLPIMNCLYRDRLSWRQSEELAKRLGLGKYHRTTIYGEKRKSNFVLVIPNYKKISNELNCSVSLIRKYMQSIDYEIVKPIKKLGPRKPMVYALGYYHNFEDKNGLLLNKAVFFLKGSPEIKYSLQTFERSK